MASESERSRPTVLVVDDNPDDLSAFERAVRTMSVTIETAATGRQGLAQCLAGTHSLVVLDYSLGDMTGTEILLRLKEAGKTVPVLIQSGIGSDFVVARALALGAAGFIAKDSKDYAQEVRDKLRGALANPYQATGTTGRTARTPPIVDVERAIDDLVERSHGVFNAVGFSSPDGFRISTRIRQMGALPAETICAMVSSVTSTSRFLGQGLESPQLRLVSAEFAGGLLLSAPISDFGFLFAVTPTTGLGATAARTEFELAVRELTNLLQSITNVEKTSY